MLLSIFAVLVLPAVAAARFVCNVCYCAFFLTHYAKVRFFPMDGYYSGVPVRRAATQAAHLAVGKKDFIRTLPDLFVCTYDAQSSSGSSESRARIDVQQTVACDVDDSADCLDENIVE